MLNITCHWYFDIDKILTLIDQALDVHIVRVAVVDWYSQLSKCDNVDTDYCESFIFLGRHSCMSLSRFPFAL